MKDNLSILKMNQLHLLVEQLCYDLLKI